MFFNLKIVNIKEETLDTKTLSLKQPGLKKIKYFPGQYLTLIFYINGRKYIRPYSFSSAPGVDEHLEVTVKRVPGGVVSNHINDFLKIGDNIEVMQPLGDFIFDPDAINKNEHIILWGAGSGITPLISIAKYILFKSSNNKVVLVYGNRNDESVIFKDKLIELEQLFPDTFKIWHFHTRPSISKNNPAVIEGRINPKKVLFIMKSELDMQNTIHFICGPTGLKESVKKTLKDISIDEERIFSENFEKVINPEDFKDITTQFIDILKDGQINKIEVAKGKSMLQAGLDAMLDLDYSCQTGSCTLCKAKVLNGSVKTIGVEKMPDTIRADECLLCCGYPLSNDVRVSVL